MCFSFQLCYVMKVIPVLCFTGLSDEGWEGVLEVTSQNFLDALERLTPSVSLEELKRYKEMEKIH